MATLRRPGEQSSAIPTELESDKIPSTSSSVRRRPPPSLPQTTTSLAHETADHSRRKNIMKSIVIQDDQKTIEDEGKMDTVAPKGGEKNDGESIVPMGTTKPVLYIPQLPRYRFENGELEVMIRESLALGHKLNVIKVTCYPLFDLGIVDLQSNEDKDRLLKHIRRIFFDLNSDQTVSFVGKLDFISYLVIKRDSNRALPNTSDVNQLWRQVHGMVTAFQCEQLQPPFQNIFRIINDPFDTLVACKPLASLSVTDCHANVYYRFDCSFLVNLPSNFTVDQFWATVTQTFSITQLDDSSFYLQHDQATSTAVVLIKANTIPGWSSIESIKMNGKSIEKHDQLCPISDCPSLSLKRDEESEETEIDATSWYETKMKSSHSNVIQFLAEPNHPIFKWRWNPDAFTEQFRRCDSSGTTKNLEESDPNGAQQNQQRHLLRTTVMLNTIGIVKRGYYTIANQAIQLKTAELKTIVYNRDSKLESFLQLSPSEQIPIPYPQTDVQVLEKDCLLVYSECVSQGYRPLLLNMANAKTPGGGYRKGDGAQEENIFRRSDYYRSLDIDLDEGYATNRFLCTADGTLEKLKSGETMYPIDHFGAIYTEGLTAFRDTEANGYALLESPTYSVAAIAVAAYRDPPLTISNELTPEHSIGTRKKIETLFAIARHHKHDSLVLSAFGCGAFRNPPKHMATIFKSVIEQYAGFFKRIVFAIVDDHNTGQRFNPLGNYQPFHGILHGFIARPIQHVEIGIAIGPWRIVHRSEDGSVTLSDIRIDSQTPCRYGGQCKDNNASEHCRSYSHPARCPLIGTPTGCSLMTDEQHLLWFKHSSNMQRGPREAYQPLCPWTPFHCRLHTALSESKHPSSVAYEVQRHCLDFVHICRFGRYCQQTSSAHRKATIHIHRRTCPYEDHCTERADDTHLNSYSHQGIADIRHLCRNAFAQCPDRDKPDHCVRFRHRDNEAANAVISFSRLNESINFIQNQREVILQFEDFSKKCAINRLPNILNSVERCIGTFLPVYQCSKSMFEFILAFGYTVPPSYIRSLNNVDAATRAILQSRGIQRLMDNYYHDRSIHDHLQAYIKEKASIAFERRFDSLGSAKSSTPYFDMLRAKMDRLEKLMGIQAFQDVARQVSAVIDAFLNLLKDAIVPNPGAENYLQTVLGPHLRAGLGNIVVIFKREVMFHPDASLSIHRRQLHCSIAGYQKAIAAELIMRAISAKQVINEDRRTVIRYMNAASPDDPLCKCHLPYFIPIEYIETVLLPTSVSRSISQDTLQLAGSIFHDRLHVVHDQDYSFAYRMQSTDIMLNAVNQRFGEHKPRLPILRGIVITLEESRFTKYVSLPCTLQQVDEDWRSIFIYWQLKYGDMMLLLSKKRIEDLQDSSLSVPSLVCYIARIPSTTAKDYVEGASYLYYGDPRHHMDLIQKERYLASSSRFHQGCDLDNDLTYCLKLEKRTGQVILCHAGPNSLYNQQQIRYRFSAAELDLTDLNYIQISAGSREVPVKNLMISSKPIEDLHPSLDKSSERLSPLAHRSDQCRAVPGDRPMDPVRMPLASGSKMSGFQMHDERTQGQDQ